MSRRAVLAALACCGIAPARAASPLLRGRIGQALRAPGPVFGLWLPASATASFTPTEPGFGLADPLVAVVVEERAPPPVDLDAVALLHAQGGSLAVNGQAPPLSLAAPPGGRVRLRLASAAPDALLALKVEGAQMQVIAIDGQPCERIALRDNAFPLAPSARFELMLDLAEGPATVVAGDVALVRIATRGENAPSRDPVAALPANPRLPADIALERARQVSVRVTPDGIGAGQPLFSVKRGTPVTLALSNASAEPQTLRLEGHSARLLHALDDGWDPYWRDVFYLPPRATLHAAFVADNPGRWRIASASPDKRAKGFAAAFTVA